MQAIYAMHQSATDDIEKQEKFLRYSLDSILDLYLIMLSVLAELRNKEEDFLNKSAKKHITTAEERNPDRKFVDNQVLMLLAIDPAFLKAIDDRKIDNFQRNDDYILILLKEVRASETYQDYMASDKNDFETDLDFVLSLYTDVLAPNEKLYEYLEDNRLTWIDDIPVVNTLLVKNLTAMTAQRSKIIVPRVYRNSEDRDFATDLFRKTVLNEKDLAKHYIDRTPNWDTDRIAEIDTIILKMAICEFTRFPSIPYKVTINEFLEIAKEYSTPKSSIFINGILDNLVKELRNNKTELKTGRGLM